MPTGGAWAAHEFRHHGRRDTRARRARRHAGILAGEASYLGPSVVWTATQGTPLKWTRQIPQGSGKLLDALGICRVWLHGFMMRSCSAWSRGPACTPYMNPACFDIRSCKRGGCAHLRPGTPKYKQNTRWWSASQGRHPGGTTTYRALQSAEACRAATSGGEEHTYFCASQLISTASLEPTFTCPVLLLRAGALRCRSSSWTT